MFEIIKKLRFDEKVFLCKDSEGVEIYVYRPSKLNKKLKNVYDVNKNFQIWLKEEQREFRPNHLRLMIDLNLRTRSKTQLKRELLTIFDNIYYGADPNEEIKLLKTEKFNHYLNSLQIISNLAQLFLIEQDYNYNKESIRYFTNNLNYINRNSAIDLIYANPEYLRYFKVKKIIGKFSIIGLI